MKKSRLKKILLFGALIGFLGACEGLFDVQDPSRFTDEDVDDALPAVANGSEGMLHLLWDYSVQIGELLTDVLAHTGTWSGWDDVDHGLITYDRQGASNMSALLRARYATQDAQMRFARVEEERDTTIGQDLWAQVQVTEAWADLALGMWHCEVPTDPVLVSTSPDVWEQGVSSTDMETFERALGKFNTAAATAQAAGSTDHEYWAIAGRARTNLYLGNYAAAASDAGQIPDGWTYDAIYDGVTNRNYIVSISTIDFNHASGIREWLWPRVDVANRVLLDAYTNEQDSRVQIYHRPGTMGVDNVTDYYSQWKYQTEGADIPFTHSDEMRLIEAEVFWRNDQLANAMTVLNGLRAAVGLSPVTATTSAEVFDVLMNERFAELFMEGHRVVDLHRFGLVKQMIDAGHFDTAQPAVTEDPRPTKFTLTDSEALYNANFEDAASARCQYMSGN